MQIGIRLHDAPGNTFREKLRNAKKQGFCCIHLALQKVAGMVSDTEALTPGYASHIKNILREEEMELAVLGCYLNLAHPDPEELKKIKDTYRAYIRFASYLGFGVVGTETGAPNAAYSYDKAACHSRESLEIFIRNLSEITTYAEKMGVVLAIEPVYCHIVWNPSVAREVLDRIDSPNLQIIFDPVNLLDRDNLSQKEELMEEAMELLGKEMAIFHLKDYVTHEGTISSVACGRGEMDYQKILRFARKHKPHIQATLEDTKPENAKDALDFIKRLEKEEENIEIV